MNRFFRIHGDNIIECERSLTLVAEAFNVKPVWDKSAPIYKPIYVFEIGNEKYVFELLPGHDRWGVDFGEILRESGAPLKEAVDSYLTEVISGKEELFLAIEYCSALPAGNNAWQRSGRAYNCAVAGVPYIYYAELGGAELDENRNFKALRFPNPIVPFSYVSASRRMGVDCIPVYRPHPSIHESDYDVFKDCCGMDECKLLIRSLFHGQDITEYRDSLVNKCFSLIDILSRNRKKHDTLRAGQWISLYNAADVCSWLVKDENYLVWNKKFSDKVSVTESFSSFKDDVLGMSMAAICSSDIPMCIVPVNKVNEFNACVHRYYPSVDYSFDETRHLVVVWIVGYKPKGEDSRPDRGLTSLARMVVGNQVQVFSIVYGPAKPETYGALYSLEGVDVNGLWQSVVELSDFVLFDSVNYPRPIFHALGLRRNLNVSHVSFPYHEASLNGAYGEHDVDSTLHQMFSHNGLSGIKECFCNPPGGDWSGISFFFHNGLEYRWTSLPRVSIVGGKRPDHIIQVFGKNLDLFLAIESKGNGRKLEKGIGENLIKYVMSVYETIPTAKREKGKHWESNANLIEIPDFQVISIGAFLYDGFSGMEALLKSKGLDAVMAIEFNDLVTCIHVMTTPRGKVLNHILEQVCLNIGNLVIKIY